MTMIKTLNMLAIRKGDLVKVKGTIKEVRRFKYDEKADSFYQEEYRECDGELFLDIYDCSDSYYSEIDLLSYYDENDIQAVYREDENGNYQLIYKKEIKLD